MFGVIPPTTQNKHPLPWYASCISFLFFNLKTNQPLIGNYHLFTPLMRLVIVTPSKLCSSKTVKFFLVKNTYFPIFFKGEIGFVLTYRYYKKNGVYKKNICSFF